MSESNKLDVSPLQPDPMRSLKHFLRLLSITGRAQRISLLRHISKSQCTHLKGLAHNLMFNSEITLTSEEKKYLTRHSGVIKQIASRRVCLEEKKNLLVDNQRLVKRLVDIGLAYLKSGEQ